MSTNLSEQDQDAWSRLAESYKTFSLALREFFSESIDRIAIMREALKGEDKHAAIYILAHLGIEDHKLLFKELVFLASYAHGAIQAIRNIILSLPRDWVLGHIEEAAEPLLRSDGDDIDDTYRRLLELYSQLDRSLALKLARRAAAHSDHDTREAGEEFLRQLESTGDERA